MILLGAGGFAKELIDILADSNGYTKKNLWFFDEKDNSRGSMYGFKILHSMQEAEEIFNQGFYEYCLAVGSSRSRYILWKKFEALHGQLKSVIHSSANIGNFDVTIGKGASIMANSSISNGTIIGTGVLINADVLVGHDVKIGDFCDISPGVKLTGHCQIGKYVNIGAGAVILPKVKIGNNSSIAAGSIVGKDIPDNSLAVGVLPSRVVSRLPEFEE